MRDDFSKPTVDLLAKRAGYLCSNPECGIFTVGAAPTADKSIIVGVAAHITAAAPGGRVTTSHSRRRKGVTAQMASGSAKYMERLSILMLTISRLKCCESGSKRQKKTLFVLS